jgi:hypothetical protein
VQLKKTLPLAYERFQAALDSLSEQIVSNGRPINYDEVGARRR